MAKKYEKGNELLCEIMDSAFKICRLIGRPQSQGYNQTFKRNFCTFQSKFIGSSDDTVLDSDLISLNKALSKGWKIKQLNLASGELENWNPKRWDTGKSVEK